MSHHRSKDLIDSGERMLEKGNLSAAVDTFNDALALDAHDPTALERKAIALAGMGDIRGAIACHDALIAGSPNDPSRQVAKGDLLAGQGQFKQAIECFDVAATLDPRDHLILKRKADALRGLGEFLEASRLLDRAIALAPSDAALWVAKGDALVDAGRVSDAMVSLERAARLDPHSFTELDWNLRGDRLYNSDAFEAAIEFYRTALVTQTNIDSWWGVARSQVAMGFYEPAVSSYEKALEIDPDNAALLNDFGVCMTYLEQWDRALACFNRIVNLETTADYAWQNIGYVHDAQNHLLSARDAYARALDLNPSNAECWVYLGEVDLTMGGDRRESALESFRRATQLDPDSQWGWNGVGRALIELTRLDEALEALDEAIAIDPSELAPWWNRAEALARLGLHRDVETCIKQAQEAIADRPGSLRLKAAMLSDWLGRHDEALAQLEGASVLAPDDESVSSDLAEMLLKVGQYAQSRAAARRVLRSTKNVNIQCGMRFVIYASYALGGGDSRARRAAFEDFIAYARTEFVDGERTKIDWSYGGLTDVLRKTSIPSETRWLLSTAIDLQLRELDPSQLSFFATSTTARAVPPVRSQGDGLQPEDVT
jgi:tetratricopeptide (TPR) repeat protein